MKLIYVVIYDYTGNSNVSAAFEEESSAYEYIKNSFYKLHLRVEAVALKEKFTDKSSSQDIHKLLEFPSKQVLNIPNIKIMWE